MIPLPISFEPGQEYFDWKGAISLQVDGVEAQESLGSTADLFELELKAMGLLVSRNEKEEVTHRVEFKIDGAVVGKEAYRLEVGAHKISIVASTPAGIFFGTRTLLATAILGKTPGGLTVDGPRFSWRGAHLDVARHFFPVADIKRFIDLLALHKMNVFHWHLTEDQGWRIEIDAFPRLTEIAAWRKVDGKQYGGFYTKAEVREVVAYAKSRFITVVPEIELPGHALATLAAYPELSCTGGPFEVETKWGIFDDVYCAGNDATIQFLETVIEEVIELFPGEFFHIGGDECPKTRWKDCAKCQARIAEKGLKDEDELQSWVISHMSEFLSSKNRRLVGWDEILEGGLAKGATVMSWRGTEGGLRAAQMQHDVVMCPTSHCYLDYRQGEGEDEPGAWFAPPLVLEDVYGYEPTPAQLSPEQAKHVLGVQGNIWTERMSTYAQVEYMTFPRLCALSEVGWSGPARNFDDFQERLKEHCILLDHYKVGYRGSPHARPERPTQDDKERFEAAKRERERSGATASY